MTSAQEPLWESDPDVIVFVTDEEELAIGAAEQHGLGETLGKAFGHPKAAVRADLHKAFDQMSFLLEGISATKRGYEATEVTFQLAFTAKGHVAFVAEAGMTTSISVTFKPIGHRDGSDD